MLGSKVVYKSASLIEVTNYDDRAVLSERSFNHPKTRQRLHLICQLGSNLCGETFAGGHQHCRRILTVLCLRQKIASDVGSSPGLIRYYDHLSRPRYRVDPDDAEDQFLCRGDIFVS